jgi:hypothetical protein
LSPPNPRETSPGRERRAAERTNFPREGIEAPLTHTIGNKVEAAYQRGDLFEKRRKLMETWASYCATAPVQERQNNVTALWAS